MDFTNELVTANAIRLNVRRIRSEGSAMVMIHGLTDNGACWGRVAERFTPEYDIVAMDLRAHGLSDTPPDGYTANDNAADVIGIIEALELGSVTLVGHSLGAETAANVARLRPDLVRQLVLEDPPWNDQWTLSQPEVREKMRQDWLLPLQESKLRSFDELLVRGRQQMPHWADEELAPWVRAQLEVRIDALRFILSDRPAWQLAVRNLHCPTLLVTGEAARGGLVSEELAEQARALCPELQVLHLAGAGHCVHRDQFERYIVGVRRFLAQS